MRACARARAGREEMGITYIGTPQSGTKECLTVIFLAFFKRMTNASTSGFLTTGSANALFSYSLSITRSVRQKEVHRSVPILTEKQESRTGLKCGNA